MVHNANYIRFYNGVSIVDEIFFFSYTHNSNIICKNQSIYMYCCVKVCGFIIISTTITQIERNNNK